MGRRYFYWFGERENIKNVRVTNVWIDQARRDGISITSAENLVLNNILISNTHGTLPEMAIQIEPSLHYGRT